MRNFSFLSLFLLFLNCNSVPAYLSDRGMDARDIVDLNFETNYGFAIEMGPYLISPFFLGFSNVGLSNGEIGSSKSGRAAVFIYQNSSTTSNSKNVEMISRLDYRKKEYCISSINDMTCGWKLEPEIQAYGKFGIRAGLIAGFRFSINFIEIADFVTGVLGFDLLNDDYYDMQKKQEKLGYATKK